MMKKLKLTVRHGYLCGILLALAAVGFTACSDKETDDKNVAFDPNQEIVISDFTPKSGSMGQQLVILGNNFGNDKSQVKVKIGGKDAKVINVCNTALYAYIPSAAFDKIEGKDLYGSVSVTIGGKTGLASDRFEYERKMIVGRLCGQSFERYEDVTWQDGGFDECTGFKNDGVMQFSPYNHDQLFIVYDQEPRFGTVAHGIQLLDLKAKTVETILPLSMFHNERLRTIDFAVDPFAYDETGAFERRQKVDETGTPLFDDDNEPIMEMIGRAPDGWEATATPNQKRWREHLIISTDNNNDQYRARSVYLVDRDANGNFSKNSKVIELANYRQCNGASLHPVNGELYFTSYTQGEVLRLEMDTYWASRDTSDAMTFKAWDPYVNNNLTDAGGNVTGTGAFEKLFTVQDVSWEFQIDIHPSGKYAYIVVINRSYILRTDYNETTKRFSAPYVIAGDMSHAGFQDGVGKSALMHRPYQGTFVKNEDYEAAGASDLYDFYFCDSENDAVRLLTPEGIVKTYAGGSAATHADGNTYGNENGELRDFARFHRPTGLVNDVHKDAITGLNTLIFYILDTYNYMIRTITMEENLDATVVNP